jgi:hypothetical protein
MGNCYALFAYGGDLSFMLIIGIALHGICYDFFCFRSNIYQLKSGEKYKSAAQGLITLALMVLDVSWFCCRWMDY